MNQTVIDLADLIARCGRGDQAAFAALYDDQSSRLYGIALRITRRPTVAADALHDAFLNVWQNAARFELARGAAEAWLTSLIRYRALDLMRRAGREVLADEIPDRADESPDPLEQLSTTLEGEALRRCLQTLDEERRALIQSAFLDGLSHSELAARSGLPLGTVKSSIRRALAVLKKCLEP